MPMALGEGEAVVTVGELPSLRTCPGIWTDGKTDIRTDGRCLRSHLVGYLSLLSFPHENSLPESVSLSGLCGEGWA